MTVKKAIAILKKQRNKLTDPKHYNDENWVSQTASFIKDFFGDHSLEYGFIKQFKFYVRSSNWDSEEDIKRWLSEKPKQAIKFLDNCIETLEDKGLYKKPKINFLSRLGDTALWAIISLGLPGLITIGFFFGNMYSDKQNIELRRENKSLKDSISVLKASTNNQNNTIVEGNLSTDTLSSNTNK
ncbi:MAG: hypothetical protein IPJ74_20915 [Saprospiraceae bacterium]|nr:hypothetical protein [Saprospiraceae bacterium]